MMVTTIDKCPECGWSGNYGKMNDYDLERHTWLPNCPECGAHADKVKYDGDPEELTTVEVVVLDQWSSTADLEGVKFKDLASGDAFDNLEGGDAEAAKKIFGGSCTTKEVRVDDRPRKGTVWLKEGENGQVEKWKFNYATK